VNVDVWLAELFARSLFVRLSIYAGCLLWILGMVMFTIGPGLLDRFERSYLADKLRPLVAGIHIALGAVAVGFFWVQIGWYSPLVVTAAGVILVSGSFGLIDEYERCRGLRTVSPKNSPAAAYQGFEWVVPEPQPLPRQEPPRPKKSKKKKVRVRLGPRSRVRGAYYIDEDLCDRRLIRLLRKHNLDVTTTLEEGRGSAKDPAQLAHSTSERRVIITCDSDYLALHERGAQHSGIIHAPKGPEWFQEILRVALRLAGEGAEV
jgi:hypothetical protein